MSNDSALDQNSRQGIICALNTDAKTPVQIKVNPASHGLEVVNGSGQMDNGNHDGNALIDGNSRFSWYGLSSDGSGQRIIVYANSSGAILIE